MPRLPDTLEPEVDLFEQLRPRLTAISRRIVEHFGGQLATLDYPAHGRASEVTVREESIFCGLPKTFTAGRYHSLHATRDGMPQGLAVTADSDDGIVMGIEHRTLPIAAVQFHPESMMTMRDGFGMRLIENVIERLVAKRPR